jgi:F0F1-type ATP synthase assembly protein I
MSSGLRLSSIGFEVVATVAGGALAGYWIDRHYRSAPWGLLIGSVLGLLAGLYNLIRETLRASREPDGGTAGTAGSEAHDGAKNGSAKR